MKTGDYLYCHTPVIMKIDLSHATTRGKYYKIVLTWPETFYITDDFGYNHGFNIDQYNENFYTSKEYRRIKLDKLYQKT